MVPVLREWWEWGRADSGGEGEHFLSSLLSPQLLSSSIMGRGLSTLLVCPSISRFLSRLHKVAVSLSGSLLPWEGAGDQWSRRGRGGTGPGGGYGREEGAGTLTSPCPFDPGCPLCPLASAEIPQRTWE